MNSLSFLSTPRSFARLLMRLTICFGLLALALPDSSHVARAATVRASVATSPAGTQGDGGSTSTQFSFSADGTKVAFYSSATNLVAGDTNGRSDIFVRDLATGTTTRVSVDSSGAQSDGSSFNPSLSADGSRVAFYSNATNLVAGDTNGTYDVFVRDLTTGTTTLASVDSSSAQSDGSSYNPSLSADGTKVAFDSFATNLVAGDTNGARDIFVRDLTTNTTARVSVDSNGAQSTSGSSDNPSLSADGTKVAFRSNATNLVTGDTNNATDVFVRDLATGNTTRVSVASSGAQGDGSSYAPNLSADGTRVAFDSDASTLVAGDTNESADVFVRDLTMGTTVRASVASGGAQSDNDSYAPSLSADGTKVAFYSFARNLVASDTNNRPDVFVRDLTTGTTTRVSVASDGTQGNSTSYFASLSADGTKVAFQSFASTLVAGDANAKSDVFVRNLSTGNTAIVSVATSPAGAQANGGSTTSQFSFSADGTEVAFTSLASNLVAGDTNGAYDVFVRDLTTGTTTRVSVASDGTQGTGGNSYTPSLSADGTKVAFSSSANNLVAGDSNGVADVFVRDLTTGTTTRVSVASDGTQGTGGNSFNPSLSADGTKVAFYSDATNLVAGDTNGARDVFVRDLTADTTVRVSVASGGTQGNGNAANPSLSADGTKVAFASDASNLVAGDSNGQSDIFVRDLTTGTTTRVSINSAGAQNPSGSSDNPSLSADGRKVAFQSYATTLVTGDTNGAADVFVRDLTTGTTTRVSVNSAGAQSNGDSSFAPSLSSDGTRVAFYSDDNNLVVGDTNARTDVFVRDLTTGTTVRASVDSGGAQVFGDSYAPSLSANGRKVAFYSFADNLVADDTNGRSDVFVADVASVAVNALSIGDVTLNEGDSNTTNFDFTVTLSAASADNVTVDYATANGTATAGNDYAATSGTLVFTPGQTSKTVTVAVTGDQGKEPNETFTVQLSNQNNATLANATATGTITNDDSGLVVTTTSDAADNPNDNDNTLREAIGVANTNTGADTISFNIPGAGVQTIQLNSALPTLAGNGAATTINGYSQPGAKANTLATGSDAVIVIEIRGNGISNFIGLTLSSAGSTIKGLSIGNCQYGIILNGAGATDNTVSGNTIGTRADGSTALANGLGIVVNDAPDNTIGGTTAGTRNVISGNSNPGVYILGTNAKGNTVSGNYLGTKADGNAALANGYGVFISNAPNNIIGGTTAGARNVISGNSNSGVTISSSGATGNMVSGNFIGVKADGNAALANGYGVFINGAPGNTIGGTTASARNVISGNSSLGVYLADSGATGNSVRGNSIFANGALGINLAGGNEDGNGVTANDAGDGDSGPNNLQNFPVLTTITSSGGNTVIKGTFNSNANQDYVLDFYDNAVADASGYGQGQSYLGSSTTITADGTVKAFTATLAGVTLTDGHFITATATRTSASDGTGALGDTSEFSLAVKFIANTAPVAVGQSATAVSGTPTNITLVATDADNDPLTYLVVAQPANGKVTIAGNVATYTSNFGYVGPDSFTFKANDGKADSNTATVNVNVIAGPAPPESGLVVTTLADIQASDGVTSLREAVDAANRDGKDSPITFAVSGTINLTGGELTLVNDGKVSITGPSAGITINAGGKSRVFTIVSGADATLSGLNITGGNNSAILNDGALTLNGSALFSNTSGGNGGAILNNGTLSIANTTLASNSAQGNGGAIFNADAATATILNSTIVGNAATAGGGIFKGKSLTLSNSIIVGNTSDNLSGVADAGGNNITSGTNAAAGLDPAGLRDNGGSVQTIALTTRGTAVNAGDNAAAASLTTDGRGAGFPRVVSSKVDIGAFESAFGNRAPSLNNATFSTSSNVPFSMQLTGTDADGDSLTYSRAGGTLPDGITLSATGLLSGTPTVVGRYDFQVNVFDGTDITVARFIVIVSSNADGVGPVITRAALNASYTRDEFANIVYRGTVRDVAPAGVTPSGVAQVTFQLRRNSDGFAYSGDEAKGFTSDVNLGYFPAFLSEPTSNTAAARDYRRTFGADGFVPSANVLKPGSYSLVIVAKDVAGNFSVEVVPVSITAATAPASSAIRGAKTASGGNS